MTRSNDRATESEPPRPPEFYRAPVDGQRCLRIEGRLRRLKLPLPAEPPEDVPPAACFLCHPERDRFDRGAWPADAPAAKSPLRVVGNAFSFATTALLVAPPDERLHRATPAALERELLAELLRAPFDVRFTQRFALAGLTVVAFMNVGVRAAQSRVHPHLQVVGFPPAATVEAADHRPADAAALAADLAAATGEGRRLALAAGSAIVPREPAMTAELWIELPSATAPIGEWTRAAADVAAACAACARGLSGSYNVVLRCAEPRLVRIIPRGLSERAGLELSIPGVVASVIAASPRETQLLWQAALAT